MKIGILGGGQLGRMFIQNALDYPIEIHILDPSANAPCRQIAHHFTQGDFNDYQTVIDFCKMVDVVGIEIEHVNIDALKKIQAEGKTIIPSPDVLEIIQDKGLQKLFYQKNNIPTAPFSLVENLEGLQKPYPYVQKTRKGGYDGKGVKIIKGIEDQKNALEGPSIVEELADIEKELAVIVVRNIEGDIKSYPVVEMVVNPQFNLVDYLLMPANIDTDIGNEAQKIALDLVKAFDSAGIFAVELFLNKNGDIWVNEIAPRVHNSGHSTIEGAYSSQFDQMLRILMNLPLGNCDAKETSAMLNIVSTANVSGTATYKGLAQIKALDKTYLHLYGKTETSFGRKMGHITILGNDLSEILPKIKTIKQEFLVV